MVSRRSDPPLSRSRPLAPADTSIKPIQPTEHARRSGFMRHLGSLPQLRRRPVLADLYGREAIWAHEPGSGSRRLAAGHAQLPGDQPADRRRMVGAGLSEQQRLRSLAVPRWRRAKIPCEYALGPSAWMQPFFRDRVARVFDERAAADRARSSHIPGHAAGVHRGTASVQAKRLLLLVD